MSDREDPEFVHPDVIPFSDTIPGILFLAFGLSVIAWGIVRWLA